MRTRSLAVVLAAVLGLAGCGASVSPTASPSPPPSGEGLWLTAEMRQAIPPAGRFTWLPSVAITSDRQLLSPGAVPAIFPGPLVSPILARPISANGLARILDLGRSLGMLGGQSDFTGGATAPGQSVGVVRLAIDGRTVELIGEPNLQPGCDPATCTPLPGTPEAFAVFWYRLHDLTRLLGEDVGPEVPWDPAGYALLIGPAPDPQGLPQKPADWPLDLPLASAGTAIGDGIHRCLTVTGADADTLRPALQSATQTTAWIQDPAASAAFGLTVRPLLPGEDFCADVVAGG